MNIDTKDMDKFSKMFEKQFPKQYAFAVKDTLNTLAFESADNFKKKVALTEFTIRNDFIQKSVMYNKTKGTNVNSMQSSFGQLAKFRGRDTTGMLDLQYEGGIKRPSTGKRLKKATVTARNKNYKKTISKQYINMPVKTSAFITSTKTQRGQSIGLLAWASRNNWTGGLLFRPPNAKGVGSYGIYTMKPQVKKPKNNDTQAIQKLELNKIFDLEKKEHPIKARNWMLKSYSQPVSKRSEIYQSYLKKQVEYLKSKNML